MALISGTNASGKLFDVVDEDGEVLGSFDHISDAIACGKAAPWYAGNVNIRRDTALNHKAHVRTQMLKHQARLAEYAF